MSRIFITFTITIILFTSIFSSAAAQKTSTPLLPYKTGTPPVIDGILDDEVWKTAPSETGFITYYPDYGKNMSEKTIVWYAYDSENLYFAFRCYDSEPDKIKTSVSSRDKVRPDDWICLNLDTFNDQQSLYAFYVNPMGIQMDSRASGDMEDFSFDIVWYSDGKIDNEGYAIEIKIPFKSIRFSADEPVEMGIIFERNISRKTEVGTYPKFDPKKGANFFTQTRTLIYKDIHHYKLVEILPAFTYGKTSSAPAGKLVTEGDNSEFSLTGKYGITSHMVMDGTINPDFSQVEADAGQVDFNQRYALFYAEKRPFFLEGIENFIFGGSTDGDPLGAIVHTRTINNPEIGFKLTGKIGKENSIASIYARDKLFNPDEEGEYANFGILRYKRALNDDSFIGGFFTDRELEKSSNKVFGADGQIRITGSSKIGFHGFWSQSKDDEESTNNKGHALGINYYYNTRDWLVNLRMHELSKNFNTESGYVTRTGVTRIRAGFSRMIHTNKKILKRFDPLLNFQYIKDKFSGEWEKSNAFYLTFILPRTSSIRIGYNFSDEIYLTKKFKTNSSSISGGSYLTKQFYLNLSYSYDYKIRYIENPYQGKGNTASAVFIYQPSDNISSQLTYIYTDFYRDIDNRKEYDYSIIRFRNTYQMNKYLFFRAILEHNSFYKELTTDFLISFTYIPGTVIHIGYGSLYQKVKWETDKYVDSSKFLETKRGFFFKTSYLWRM